MGLFKFLFPKMNKYIVDADLTINALKNDRQDLVTKIDELFIQISHLREKIPSAEIVGLLLESSNENLLDNFSDTLKHGEQIQEIQRIIQKYNDSREEQVKKEKEDLTKYLTKEFEKLNTLCKKDKETTTAITDLKRGLETKISNVTSEIKINHSKNSDLLTSVNGHFKQYDKTIRQILEILVEIKKDKNLDPKMFVNEFKKISEGYSKLLKEFSALSKVVGYTDKTEEVLTNVQKSNTQIMRRIEILESKLSRLFSSRQGNRKA